MQGAHAGLASGKQRTGGSNESLEPGTKEGSSPSFYLALGWVLSVGVNKHCDLAGVLTRGCSFCFLDGTSFFQVGLALLQPSITCGGWAGSGHTTPRMIRKRCLQCADQLGNCLFLLPGMTPAASQIQLPRTPLG